MTDTIVCSPNDESKADLYAGFAMSSADWSRRAVKAAEMGNHESARTFRAVARVADDVARGGQS